MHHTYTHAESKFKTSNDPVDSVDNHHVWFGLKITNTLPAVFQNLLQGFPSPATGLSYQGTCGSPLRGDGVS